MARKLVCSADDLEALAEERGLLPFFACEFPNISVEDFTPSKYWFAADTDGPWEWRMEVARRGKVAYGKLFSGKAGLVSRTWYPDLANYRRDGYDFDARYEEGLAGYKDKCIMDALLREGPLLTHALKRAAGFGRDGMRGFDTVITRLQMQTYVTIQGFEYRRDKLGRPYGWGVARYAITEDVLGPEVTRAAYGRDPAASQDRLVAHLSTLCPGAFLEDLARFIR